MNEDLHPVRPSECNNLPGQVVLVFQGGGALGSYQAGVYQALHEADIELDHRDFDRRDQRQLDRGQSPRGQNSKAQGILETG